jgi:hypothetical protein
MRVPCILECNRKESVKSNRRAISGRLSDRVDSVEKEETAVSDLQIEAQQDPGKSAPRCAGVAVGGTLYEGA